jgi:hypothetical protein
MEVENRGTLRTYENRGTLRTYDTSKRKNQTLCPFSSCVSVENLFRKGCNMSFKAIFKLKECIVKNTQRHTLTVNESPNVLLYFPRSQSCTSKVIHVCHLANDRRQKGYLYRIQLLPTFPPSALGVPAVMACCNNATKLDCAAVSWPGRACPTDFGASVTTDGCLEARASISSKFCTPGSDA